MYESQQTLFSAKASNNQDVSNERKRLKQSTMDEFPNDDEIDDLFLEGSIVQDIDPWLQGSSALSKSQQASSQSSEKMDLEYPDSEDELDLMTQKNTMGKDQLAKLTSTQMVDR